MLFSGRLLCQKYGVLDGPLKRKEKGSCERQTLEINWVFGVRNWF